MGGWIVFVVRRASFFVVFCLGKKAGVCMDGWMDGWMDGRWMEVGNWVDGWVDGWMG